MALATPLLLALLACAAPASEAEAREGEEAAAQPAAPTDDTSASGGRTIMRIAVYEFELGGVEPRVGAIVVDSVVDELRKLQRVSVIGTREIRAMLDLEANKQAMGCDSDSSCLSEIADALGADVLVIGSITDIGNERMFAMRRIDQRRAELVSSYSQRLAPAGGEELLAAVGPAIEEMFPELELKRGIKRGVSDEVALRLNPPPLSPWTTATMAGASSALLLAGVASTVVNVVGFALYERELDKGRGQSPSGVALSDLSGFAAVTNISLFLQVGLLGGGVVAGVSAGVMALFTDWQGAGQWHQEE